MSGRISRCCKPHEWTILIFGDEAVNLGFLYMYHRDRDCNARRQQHCTSFIWPMATYSTSARVVHSARMPGRCSMRLAVFIDETCVSSVPLLPGHLQIHYIEARCCRKVLISVFVVEASLFGRRRFAGLRLVGFDLSSLLRSNMSRRLQPRHVFLQSARPGYCVNDRLECTKTYYCGHEH